MEMNVLYFCSDAFSKVAAVTITSLLENNKNFEEINIYLVGDEEIGRASCRERV